MEATGKSYKVYKNFVTGEVSCEVLIETIHSQHRAFTAIYKKNYERSMGGVRMVTNGTAQEAARLARGMAEKCALNSIPANGQKCLIICSNQIPEDAMERASIVDYHLNIVKKIEPGVIFGPDMGTPEEIMDLVADKFNHLDNVTGLSREHGGLEIDKNGYTAIGAYEAFEQITQRKKGLHSVSIQGFGAVGSYFLKLMDLSEYSIAGISNLRGTLMIKSQQFNKERLLELFHHSGDDCLELFALESDKFQFVADRSFIYKLQADVFIPAARTTSIARDGELNAARNENPEVIGVNDFMREVQPALIIEIANHPLSYDAEKYLEEHGVLILPDFMVNCGGMIGCHTEWKNRQTLREKPEEYDHVNEQCKKMIIQEMKNNIGELMAIPGSKRNIANEMMHRRLKTTIATYKSSL